MKLHRLVTVIAVLAVACTVVTPPDGNNGLLTPEVRMAALQAINTKAFALTGATVDDRREELLTYLFSRPEIAVAGVSEDGSLWALFTDERPLIIVANQEEDPAAAALSSGKIEVQGTSAPPELPNSVKAVVMLGGDKVLSDTHNEEVKAQLRKRNYAVSGSLATLDDLKTIVKQVGVFYFRGHGGYGFTATGRNMYAPLSATPVTVQNDIKYATDWDNKRLTYQFRLTGSYRPGLNAQTGSHYGFNAEFVKEYFEFEPGSIVYMSTCLSDPEQADWKQAFLDKGAGGYWGYDGSFTDGFDNNLTALVFDRLLGLNEYQPESPKQRPFGSASIKRWLANNDKDYTVGAVEFTFTPGTVNHTGALAPSIEYMTMDESSNTLYLKGQFGANMPGNRAEMNGNTVTVKNWAKEEIQLEIPLTGDQSAGEIKVFSRNRESNPRTLSQWRINFNLKFLPGTNTLKWEGPIRVHIRADVQDYREEAGDAPVFRFGGVPIMIARDTDGDLTGSGDDGVAGPSKTFWEGTSHLVARITNAGTANPIDGIGSIDTEFKQMRLFFAVSSTTGLFSRQQSTLVPLPAVWAYPGDGPVSIFNPLPAMVMPLANDFTLTGDQRVLPVMVSPVLSWQTLTPAHKPVNTTPR